MHVSTDLRHTLGRALTLAFGGVLWSQVLHEAIGAHGHAESSPLTHWLRDSTLALPAVTIAVWLAGRASSRLVFDERVPSRLRWAVPIVVTAGAAGAALALGATVHAGLFPAETHGEHLPVALHTARDFLMILPIAVVLSAAFQAAAALRVAPRQLAAGVLAGVLATPATLTAVAVVGAEAGAGPSAPCGRTVVADVVALDQPFFYNRLGAYNPAGMIYALRRDVVRSDDETTGPLESGNVKLRSDKRPRPLTLRMNVGDCLRIEFENLLASERVDSEQPVSRAASIHVNGLQVVDGLDDDGSFVGRNASALVEPGESRTYTLYAEHENTYLLYDGGALTGAEALGGSNGFGLFGAVNVEPAGSEWYRSQVTRDEMDLATVDEFGTGHPWLDYDAVYPAGDPDPSKTGLPVLSMTRDRPDLGPGTVELVHSDLNAIITGPDRGHFPEAAPNPISGDRTEPFREFTVIFHDEIFARQAFPDFFKSPEFEAALHSVRDGFAINYGSAGAGAEILANRLGVGPMGDCPECKYEEFFLSSWAVGDPAVVVDVPANQGGPATKALFPDDPSNVHHSYLNDRVKFRNLSAGSKEHHVFHLHAHQWQGNPEDSNSEYLDSQHIGPGSGFTYEIAYGGSGNRNKSPGDSIFHCHFYPHFAQGMWELWRVHDTFERGTKLDGQGRPMPGARALPDGEIVAGTPIPGLVPIPGKAMAPIPGDTQIAQQDIDDDGILDPGGQVEVTEPVDGDGKPERNVGFPLFIPGVAGHRAPTPPLDLADDGGLRRHVITSGTTNTSVTPTDLDKVLTSATVRYLPEGGTGPERAAMDFHAQPGHPTPEPDGTPDTFATNGRPPVAGAPFADPCRADDGTAIAMDRTYKGAVFELDLKFNKAGWHFPQQRIAALWRDVQRTLDGDRPAEPLVMRLNAGDCAEFQHTNLTPSVFQLDDFQVKTPTDVVGQHIHLVKFDVMASDGSANGFNYEDGTLSPDEVRERIHAIVAGGGCGDGGEEACPTAEPHPFFGAGPGGRWAGARTTIQRWYADPLLEHSWDDGLGAVFTHDHYAPSTHQQAGLYSTVLIEPSVSVWRDPETGVEFGSRDDGGPTSWRADILMASPYESQSHREFYLEFTDMAPAYEAGRGGGASAPVPDFPGAINPPYRDQPPDPADLFLFPNHCKNDRPRPCPEAISADDAGTFTVNYRNEPLGLRVRDPATGTQAKGAAGDLSLAFSSGVNRNDPALNVQPSPPLTGGVQPGDPYTPLLRAYKGDNVRIRMQAGGQEEQHNLTVYGTKWRREHLVLNSGWRNSQAAGISEYFILDLPVEPDPQAAGGTTDYLYAVGASTEDLWNGAWGLMRAYGKPQGDLLELPKNPIPTTGVRIDNARDFVGPCPKTARTRTYDVSAVAAGDVLPGGTLVYNSRAPGASAQFQGPLHDPTALLYVPTNDLVVDPATGRPVGLKPGTPVEPLVLRANAGDCIEVTLRNRLPAVLADLPGNSALPPVVHKDHNADLAGGITTFNANDTHPSARVGLHPQLLAYDASRHNGVDVGFNPTLTVERGQSTLYRWYAGDLVSERNSKGQRIMTATPVEFGATGLTPADPIEQTGKGLVGALVVEPAESTWKVDPVSRTSATITKADGTSFREFVAIWQTDVNLRYGNGTPVEAIGGEGSAGVPEDSEDSGQKAVNYRTEPLWARLGIAPHTPFEDVADIPVASVYSNGQAGGRDPETPVFVSSPAGPHETRLRLVVPGGHARGNVLTVHGHAWPRYPYAADSTVISADNPLTWWTGSQEGIGPLSHFDVVIPHLGGPNRVRGDYLFRDEASFGSYQGLWGLLRLNVSPPMAGADSATTAAGTAVTIPVLANDLDLDGDLNPGSVTVATGPGKGTVKIGSDGSVTYAPKSGFSGTDRFTYQVGDAAGTGMSNPATVTITVESGSRKKR